MSIEDLYEWFTENGVVIDRHHHTRSRHEYDTDGIAINKGDWLINEWTGRRGTRPHPTCQHKFEYLLDKQARLEYLGGWTDDHLAVKYYLYEYFLSSIEYKITKKRLDETIDSVVDRVFSPWGACLLDDLEHKTVDKGGKVDIAPSIIDSKKRKSLQKKGERKFNDYWIGRMIDGEPGRTAYYYAKKSREWAVGVNGKGWSKDTVKDFMVRKGIDE